MIMGDNAKIIKAVFISELKNRFRCLVSLNGEETLCYVPSSCKLSNFVELAGSTVFLKEMTYPSGIRYALYAVETTRGLVLLNLALANEVMENQLRRRYFSFLGKRKQIRREAVIDGYRSDLYIKETDTIVEIKTVLSFHDTAHFPTVSSQRAITQLSRIMDLLDSGHQVSYLFVSLGPHVKKLCLDGEKRYNELFEKCVDKGMSYCGCALEIVNNEIRVASRVEILRNNDDQ